MRVLGHWRKRVMLLSERVLDRVVRPYAGWAKETGMNTEPNEPAGALLIETTYGKGAG